jgi:hypothetical protein
VSDAKRGERKLESFIEWSGRRLVELAAKLPRRHTLLEAFIRGDKINWDIWDVKQKRESK